jgi:hypothetical protein
MNTKRATHRPLYCRQQRLDPLPQLVGQHSAAHPTACPGPAHTLQRQALMAQLPGRHPGGPLHRRAADTPAGPALRRPQQD